MTNRINDQLTQRIIYCVFRVHRTLGPGFVEKIYRRALLLELQKQSLFTETEKEVLIFYDGCKIGFHRYPPNLPSYGDMAMSQMLAMSPMLAIFISLPPATWPPPRILEPGHRVDT